MKLFVIGLVAGYLLTVAANEIIGRWNLGCDISSPLFYLLFAVVFIPCLIVFQLRTLIDAVSIERWETWRKGAPWVKIHRVCGNVFFCYDKRADTWFHCAWFTRVKSEG